MEYIDPFVIALRRRLCVTKAFRDRDRFLMQKQQIASHINRLGRLL